MVSPKPLASLSSGLLARPGAAKPAMRPQAFAQTQLEDLGWNDMGHPPAQSTLSAKPSPVPSVLAERAKLAGAISDAKPRGKAAAAKPVVTRPLAVPAIAGRKAAFTLRLDADRHLRLRLASAVDGRSSQQLVVEALDAYLSGQPEVEALARQVPAAERADREK